MPSHRPLSLAPSDLAALLEYLVLAQKTLLDTAALAELRSGSCNPMVAHMNRHASAVADLRERLAHELRRADVASQPVLR